MRDTTSNRVVRRRITLLPQKFSTRAPIRSSRVPRQVDVRKSWQIALLQTREVRTTASGHDLVDASFSQLPLVVEVPVPLDDQRVFCGFGSVPTLKFGVSFEIQRRQQAFFGLVRGIFQDFEKLKLGCDLESGSSPTQVVISSTSSEAHQNLIPAPRMGKVIRIY